MSAHSHTYKISIIIMPWMGDLLKTGAHQPTWFLEIAFVWEVGMYVCVCAFQAMKT